MCTDAIATTGEEGGVDSMQQPDIPPVRDTADLEQLHYDHTVVPGLGLTGWWAD